METCYTNLANAVILQAAKDYRRALHRLKKAPWEKDAKRRKRECVLVLTPVVPTFVKDSTVNGTV